MTRPPQDAVYVEMTTHVLCRRLKVEAQFDSRLPRAPTAVTMLVTGTAERKVIRCTTRAAGSLASNRSCDFLAGNSMQQT